MKNNAAQITGGKTVAYIEGGRSIKLTDMLQVDASNIRKYDSLERAQRHYYGKRATSLADRVLDALLVLDKQDTHLKSMHSDAVAKWIADSQPGECPRRTQPPLDRLFELFSEIFPQITLHYDTERRMLSVHKHGVSYGPSRLSDGEKQVFSILADLSELDTNHTLIVADEPELNLHPELAERLWTLIENEFPNKVFIYATHSISFALRDNVQRVWVLSSDAANIIEFTGLESLPRAETTAFLGGLPGILSANRVIVTEGHEKSFDAIFYRWLVGDQRIEIHPCGGCSEVAAVVSKSGLWNKISSSIELRGVVDADYRDDEYLETLKSDSMHVLQFHEAESYLCVPEVICAVADRIGSQENQLSETDVVALIMAELQTKKISIAARRVFAKSRIALAVSVERSLLAASNNRDALVDLIKSAAVDELRKANVTLAPALVESSFDAECAQIEQAISEHNVEMALRLLPAKELLNQLAPRAGCRNGSDLMRSLRRNFNPNDFAIMRDLAGIFAVHQH